MIRKRQAGRFSCGPAEVQCARKWCSGGSRGQQWARKTVSWEQRKQKAWGAKLGPRQQRTVNNKIRDYKVQRRKRRVNGREQVWVPSILHTITWAASFQRPSETSSSSKSINTHCRNSWTTISRSNHVHRVHYYVPGIVVNSLYILIHLFIPRAQWESTDCYFIFTEKETEAQRDEATFPSHPAGKSQTLDLNLSRLGPEANFLIIFSHPFPKTTWGRRVNIPFPSLKLKKKTQLYSKHKGEKQT